MNKNARCVMLVLSRNGSPIPECEERLRELERRGYIVWRARGSSSDDSMRSQLASDALAKGFDELMWIGGEIVFDPNDIERLREHNLPIVGAMVAKTSGRQFAVAFLPGTDRIPFGKQGGLIELQYAGFGFMHIRRAVFETIAKQLKLPVCNTRFGKPLFPYFQPIVVSDGAEASWYLEGDFAFCERARQSGFKIVADTRVRVWHVGSYPYSWEETVGEPRRGAEFIFDVGPAIRPGSAGASPSLTVPAPPHQIFRGAAKPLAPEFPRLRAYLVTYEANRESAALTRDNFRQSDWGEEPAVFVQPADWPVDKESSSKNYKRVLEQAAADRCDFALILEDDVRVCRFLRHNLSKLPLVRRDQCDYLSLFMPDILSSPWQRHEAALGYRLAKPLYVGPNQMWEKFRIWGSQAMLFSRRFILAALERWDRLSEGQDTRVISVCSELQLPLWYTAPCLAQHVPLRSAFGTPTAFAPDFQEDFRLEIGAGFQPPEEVPGSLSLEEAKLLWEMAKGEVVLELGTAWGRSTICLAQRAKRVVSIDRGDQSEVAEWLRRFGLSERVLLRRGDIAVVGPVLLNDRFGFAFIDTDHDAQSVSRDIDLVLKVLESGGLIAFHDYPNPVWPDIRKVVDHYAKRLGWQRIAQAGYVGVFRTA